jgi:hypothetical protein
MWYILEFINSVRDSLNFILLFENLIKLNAKIEQNRASKW